MADVTLAGSVAGVSAVVGYFNVPDAPELIRGIRLVAEGGRYPLRSIPYPATRRDVAQVERVEVVAERALTGPTLWAGSTWFRAAVDGGGYSAVGSTRSTAIALGAFTEGQRKTLDLELTVPAGADIRSDALQINLGIGVDY